MAGVPSSVWVASLAHRWLDEQFWTLADHLQARPWAFTVKSG